MYKFQIFWYCKGIKYNYNWPIMNFIDPFRFGSLHACVMDSGFLAFGSVTISWGFVDLNSSCLVYNNAITFFHTPIIFIILKKVLK